LQVALDGGQLILIAQSDAQRIFELHPAYESEKGIDNRVSTGCVFLLVQRADVIDEDDFAVRSFEESQDLLETLGRDL